MKKKITFYQHSYKKEEWSEEKRGFITQNHDNSELKKEMQDVAEEFAYSEGLQTKDVLNLLRTYYRFFKPKSMEFEPNRITK